MFSKLINLFKRNNKKIEFDDEVYVVDKDSNKLFVGRIKIYTYDKIILERTESVEFNAENVKD